MIRRSGRHARASSSAFGVRERRRVSSGADRLAPTRCSDRILRRRRRTGYAFVDHSSVPGSAFAMVRVRPDARGEGSGSGLVRLPPSRARGLGKESAWVRSSLTTPVLRFAEARGFAEVSRDVELTRRLRPGDGHVRDGNLSSCAKSTGGAHTRSRPPRAGHGHRRAGEGAPLRRVAEAGARERSRRPSSPSRTAASPATRPCRRSATHTEPARARVHRRPPRYRRRGFATALGDAQLAWAAARGYEELFTTTGVTNAALRARRRSSGTEERPGPILVRGPV